jgi:leucyl/phenylalanyl-tRNA--protein transferase
MIPWIERNEPFPPVEEALRRPSGLLCAGADLSPARLVDAYRHGIFPWFSTGEPILWWSPDPRMVLFPRELRISRSLGKTLRRGGYTVRLDSAFAEVIRACAEPRSSAGGTWITTQMQEAYGALHELGHAHSVETWVGGKLSGGLYGVAIGRAFYGESMFSHASDASKIALAHLVRLLERRGYVVIDCQMTTAHLASLGAREIRRGEFVHGLKDWTAEVGGLFGPGKWPENEVEDIFSESNG